MRTDKELLAYYGAGNKTAFTVLYQRHVGPLTGILFQKCRDQQMAEEQAHQALAALSEHIDTFDIDKPVMPWLTKAGMNAIRDEGRRKKRKPASSTTGADGRVIDLADAKMDEPDDIAEMMEKRQGVQQAMAEMPEINSEALRLHYFDGLTYQEAADRLDISRRTFRERLDEGREMLKRWMKRNGGAPD